MCRCKCSCLTLFYCIITRPNFKSSSLEIFICRSYRNSPLYPLGTINLKMTSDPLQIRPFKYMWVRERIINFHNKRKFQSSHYWAVDLLASTDQRKISRRTVAWEQQEIKLFEKKSAWCESFLFYFIFKHNLSWSVAFILIRNLKTFFFSFNQDSLILKRSNGGKLSFVSGIENDFLMNFPSETDSFMVFLLLNFYLNRNWHLIIVECDEGSLKHVIYYRKLPSVRFQVSWKDSISKIHFLSNWLPSKLFRAHRK